MNGSPDRHTKNCRRGMILRTTLHTFHGSAVLQPIGIQAVNSNKWLPSDFIYHTGLSLYYIFFSKKK